jgi:hypothetical protein
VEILACLGAEQEHLVWKMGLQLIVNAAHFLAQSSRKASRPVQLEGMTPLLHLARLVRDHFRAHWLWLD